MVWYDRLSKLTPRKSLRVRTIRRLKRQAPLQFVHADSMKPLPHALYNGAPVWMLSPLANEEDVERDAHNRLEAALSEIRDEQRRRVLGSDSVDGRVIPIHAAHGFQLGALDVERQVMHVSNAKSFKHRLQP